MIGSAPGEYIWDLATYTSNSGQTRINPQKKLYCVKGGEGFGNTSAIVTYNTKYDLRTQKSVIANLPTEIYSDIAKTYYNQILVLLDNIYVPGESTTADRTALLKAAGIDYSEDEEFASSQLTDDDIETVQQMAFWYYTNKDYKPSYSQNDLWTISIKNSDTGNLYMLIDWDKNSSNPKWATRGEQMNSLYKYLLQTAENNKSQYDSTTQLGDPITISSDKLNLTTSGSNYRVGPIKVTKNSSVPYTLDFVVKNGSGSTISITDNSFVDVNGNKIDKNTAENFYIDIPQSSGNKISVDITINWKTTDATLWLAGNSTVEQPLIEPAKTSKSKEVNLSTDDPSVFDLALRKYITKIDGVNLTNSRTPTVDTTKLNSGESTTACYKHRKDPVTIKKGNVVTYNLTVYNEGEKAGRATKIVDQLPAELQLKTTGTVQSTKGNTYSINYDETNNKVTFTTTGENNISAYDQSTVDSDTIEIECTVTGTASETNRKILTNLAWISEEINAVDNITIINQQGKDRDSEPATITTKTKDELVTNSKGYIGHSDNQNKDWTDPTQCFKGQQDDDDFEKLLLMPESFDLKLIKRITAVNGNTVTERIKSIDTSKLNKLDDEGKIMETTADYDLDKDPIPVKKGDIVTYTFRVYNEGTIDGYATELTEDIPNGLKFIFVPEGEEASEAEKAASDFNMANGWTYDSTLKYITTTNLALHPLINGTPDTQAHTENLIKAFGENDGTKTFSEENYKEISVKMKVVSENTEGGIRNEAEISEDSDKDGNEIDDRDSDPHKWVKYEDDEDYDRIILSTFDLSLRKFISAVSSDSTISEGDYLTDDGKVDGTYTRGPIVDTTSLDSGTTATYNHTKTPLEVQKGNTVVYTIRVYNEGTEDGYASKITDHLPAELEYVTNSTINSKYGWTISEDGRTATTEYLAADSFKLQARKANTESTNPYSLRYFEVQIECKVKDDASIVHGQKITNIADISEYRDANKQVINPDRDSTSNNVVLPTDAELPTYKDTEIESGATYIPGQEDDDDFEKIYIEKAKFDLALRKFATSVNGTAVDSREPVLGEWRLDDGTTTAKTHSKTPVAVSTGDTVRYTIRVYNEGNVDGTATEITDNLPEGLEYIDNEFNRAQGWTANGRIIKSTKLAGETISAFNGVSLDYKDVQIECKVIATKVNGYNLRNLASITGDNGDDIDSSPDVNPTNDSSYPTSSTPQGKGQEDDDDFEELKLKVVDFALRKFITSVDGTATTGREPSPDVSKLIPNGTETTAIYNHSKEPLTVRKGSTVVYTIRVYNEGETDGYAAKVTDHLPSNLEFVKDSTINSQYGWTETAEGTITTEALSTDANLIKAFDGTKLDYKDLKIECKVKDSAKVDQKETNIAEISRYENVNHVIVNPDRDSTSSNVNIPEDLPGYKDDEIASGKTYIPGQEDDDDFEKVYVPKFDLALRKFITNINGTEETSRIPQVDATKLISGESTTATYTHPKDPVKIAVDDVVTYTIRVYNEGDIDGYAAEIADDMPEHLIFLPDNAVNKQYGWKMYDEQGNETTDISKTVQIKTTYLSKENESSEGANLIKAFDKNAEVSDTNPDHKEVKVAFQVSNTAQAKKVITNYAQVYKHTDKNGDPVDDIDSTPGKWIDGEDDQDIENLIPQIFDLGLLKYVTQVQVTEDGKTTTTNTNNVGNHDTDIIPKVEVNKKKLNSTTVKFIYTIKVINISDVAGNPQEIIDYIPEGLEFIAKDNPQWTVKSDGVVSTNALVNTRLEPGQSADVKITLEWINGANNMGLKHNVAQMADKQDYADVLLSIKTGQVQLYIILGASVLLVLAGGIFLIKKYVL